MPLTGAGNGSVVVTENVGTWGIVVAGVPGVNGGATDDAP
jgi:hypothetical protein